MINRDHAGNQEQDRSSTGRALGVKFQQCDKRTPHVPELPDITVYIDALERRILAERLQKVRLTSPFLLRTVDPPIASVEGKKVMELRRLGKRIAIGFEDDLWLVLHLMIAGRLHWKKRTAQARGQQNMATFDFPTGTLVLTEAGSKKTASLHVAVGENGLSAFDPGGLEVLDADLDAFRASLTLENHTLKRALTDPRLFSGIGNAYSDEILHRARLSPVAMTHKLKPEEIERLHHATKDTLTQWIEKLRTDTGEGFPMKVTAFRDSMKVHGRYGKPCPDCGAPVQRIRYATNETNYCPQCQTRGRLLADRALSRLLRKDWPRTLDKLEALGRSGPV
jgi:formamidopyrimidine-DNA glycosylase